ncbi:MAG: hypothetical protein EP330_24825 [Deltaproteobacteria bacterium]|nr:MAG: hypothetical protein EP330_24825 [Deltaproteobacteria bacterium]
MDELARFEVAQDSTGVTWRFGNTALGPEARVVQLFVSWVLIVGPLTLWAVALQLATLWESLEWWLVNENVLVWRYMLIGAPVWVGLALPLDLWWLRPTRVTVKLTGTRLEIETPGSTRRLFLSDIQSIEVQARSMSRQALLVHTREGVIEEVLSCGLAAGEVLRSRITRAREAVAGSEADVPTHLRALRGESQRDG